MSKLPSKALNWPIIFEGVQLIAESEGCRLQSYLCPAGVWTIGWGETSGVKQGMVWTQEQADNIFCKSLQKFTKEVEALVKDSINEYQLAAFVSLAYNIGITAFKGSSALRHHNAGNFAQAANAIQLWNKATVNGKKVVLNGLVTRRAKETALYLQEPKEFKGQIVELPPVLPDADPDLDKPLVKSASAQAGAAITATAATAGVAEVVNELAPTIDVVNTIMRWSLPVMIIVGLVVGGVVIYRAWKRRQDGSN